MAAQRRNDSDKSELEKIVRSPFERLFHAALLVLGAVIAINVAIAYLGPILPWIIGGAVLAVAGWAVTAYVRWRRQQW
jgi:hypothetical protein